MSEKPASVIALRTTQNKISSMALRLHAKLRRETQRGEGKWRENRHNKAEGSDGGAARK